MMPGDWLLTSKEVVTPKSTVVLTFPVKAVLTCSWLGRGQVSFLVVPGKFPAAFFFFLRSVREAPWPLYFPSLLRGQYLWVWALSPVAWQMVHLYLLSTGQVTRPPAFFIV